MSHLDPAPETRSTYLKVRLTPSERSQIRNQADATRTTVSGWVRQVLLAVPPRRKLSRLERQLVFELHRIGNNLNQLAKLANSRGVPASETALAPLLEELHNLIGQVRNR